MMGNWIEELRREGSVPSVAFFEECAEVLRVVAIIQEDVQGSLPARNSVDAEGVSPERVVATVKYINAVADGTRVISEMALCRIVDNYTVYMSQMIALIFKTDPKTMRSGGTLPYSEILRHNSMDELMATIADKEMEKLTRNLEDLNAYIIKTFNLSPFGDDEEVLNEAVAYNGLRNIIVHNRGIIDRKFKKDVKMDYGEVGDRIFAYEPTYQSLRLFSEAVDDFDAQAVKKYNLKIVPRIRIVESEV